MHNGGGLTIIMVFGSRRRDNRRDEKKKKKQKKKARENFDKNSQMRQENRLVKQDKRVKSRAIQSMSMPELEDMFKIALGYQWLTTADISTASKQKAASQRITKSMRAASDRMRKSGKRKALKPLKNPFTGEYREWAIMIAGVAALAILRNSGFQGRRQQPPTWPLNFEYSPYTSVNSNIEATVNNLFANVESANESVVPGQTINLSAV